jgi:hypothetical protein
LIGCFILLIPFLAYGQDDLYRIKTPNVMIIFDTSNSMDQKPDGLSQGAGVAKGIDGSKLLPAEAGSFVFGWKPTKAHHRS